MVGVVTGGCGLVFLINTMIVGVKFSFWRSTHAQMGKIRVNAVLLTFACIK